MLKRFIIIWCLIFSVPHSILGADNALVPIDNQPNLQIGRLVPQIQQEEQTDGIFERITNNRAFQFARGMNEKVFIPARFMVKPALNFLVPGSGDAIDSIASISNTIGVVTNLIDAGADVEHGNYFNAFYHFGAATFFYSDSKEESANNNSKEVKNKTSTEIKRKRVDNEPLKPQIKRVKIDTSFRQKNNINIQS